jgi:hypothetical protein
LAESKTCEFAENATPLLATGNNPLSIRFIRIHNTFFDGRPLNRLLSILNEFIKIS